MSYTPTNWQTGDTITAPLLNKMEQGIASAGGGGALMVTITWTETGLFLNKTWQEIYDAASTMPVIGIQVDDDGTITQMILQNVSEYEGTYYVMIADITYTTDSATGYPESLF